MLLGPTDRLIQGSCCCMEDTVWWLQPQLVDTAHRDDGWDTVEYLWVGSSGKHTVLLRGACSQKLVWARVDLAASRALLGLHGPVVVWEGRDTLYMWWAGGSLLVFLWWWFGFGAGWRPLLLSASRLQHDCCAIPRCCCSRCLGAWDLAVCCASRAPYGNMACGPAGCDGAAACSDATKVAWWLLSKAPHLLV